MRVIDGRPELANEIVTAPVEVREYLRDRLSAVLKLNYLAEAIAEYVDHGREELVLARLRSLALLQEGGSN